MKIVLIIIGCVACIWIGLLAFTNIIQYLIFAITKDSKWISVVRETSIYSTEYNEWYIIPTISFHFEFTNKTYPTFGITWLRWRFNLSYHLKDDIEDSAIAKYIYEGRNEENES